MINILKNIYHNNTLLQKFINTFYFQFIVKGKYDKLLSSKQVQELNEYEFKDYKVKKELQIKKLGKLLIHCFENVPYYTKIFNEKNIQKSDIVANPVLVLKTLPLLTKEKVNQNWDELIATNYKHTAPNIITTGGSTGTPQKFYLSDEEMRVRDAHWYRWEKMAGVRRYELQDRMLYIGMYAKALEDNSAIGKITKENYYLLSALNMNKERIKSIFGELSSFNPTYIRGYASACYIFAKYINELEFKLNIKAVLTSSDQLHDYMRETIETTFNCKVYDFYGQNEDIATATQCENTNVYHINMENNLIYTDSNSNIIATHLEHFMMPLLNYQVNDLGEIIEDYECSCGRKGNVFKKIIGRVDDYLISANGNKYAAGALNQPMKSDTQSFKEIQYIQDTKESLQINYVKSFGFNNDSLKKLQENISKYTNNEFELIFIEYKGQIPRLKNGKFRMIIRNFKDETDS